MANFPTSIWDGNYRSVVGLLAKQHEEFIEPHILHSLSLDLNDIATEIIALQTYVLSPTFITANGVTLNYGSSSDSVTDLQTQLDGNIYSIDEAADTPGIELEVDFTGVVKFTKVIVKAYYAGGSTHGVRIQLYNNDSDAWDTLHTLYSGIDHQQCTLIVPDDTNYIDTGVVIVRFYHTELGNASHDLYIDWCALG